MDYTTYYKSLWDLVRRPSEPEQHNDLCAQVSQFSSVVSSAEGISREQWIESLAVAASFAVSGFEWAGPETLKQAERWTKVISEHLGMDAYNGTLAPDVFRAMCTSHVKPYFGSRAGDRPSSQPQFTLLAGGKKTTLSDTDRWRKQPQCIATFTWALDHVEDKGIKELTSYILPVILALVEDYDCQAKIWGLRVAQVLLDRGGSEFLRKSGIAGLVDKSTRGCLVYRSESGGAELLRLGFGTAIKVARIMYPLKDDSRYAQQWWMLAERVVANNVYVSENIAANSVLCEQCTPLCQALGPAIARYLRPLVGILAQCLHSPVYLSSSIAQLHLAAIGQFDALILACPQRASTYTADIVAALAYSWSSTLHEQCSGVVNVGLIQELTLSVLGRLNHESPDIVGIAITRLHDARPAVFAQWKQAFVTK
ncbi:hypothetical protein GGI04_000923 [Coemansia thaxteri]|uniref:Uncharacterized protein n=1 Tax=Coemansia thaxteri TaxID=2663907 RepID=A0A9W8BGF9_9FUNG|nr:hypothetical protein H4R26_001176 [Coemansia thaxteri]KAJ2008876.1 hypothetical protein GGI04_000923 [Coemansia thaxteri]KAJ2473447.1 hypothetical protein GGI02_000858 [Coemansia sp. RSA 2322]KAJ2481539.1 hypothetical protein EV174_003443 [Coemansia sp. RSA 2320]